ncbi:succinate dehydrogenase assembly factor 3, mitochondrial-like [Ptychodera flava]|uniref:succinate dehydrogenase assembly factor 3, mitochondrial-like n=1 Tax=Ptychodera flava TaxID=63121 RepID=UPI00396A2CA9
MASHASAVRALYKRVLSLHRGLPLDLRGIGDQYVKDEFRRHKNASKEEVQKFMKEWEVYANTLVLQMGQGEMSKIGVHLTEDKVDNLREDQVGQLHELFQETTKPNPFQPPEEDR